VKSHFASIDRLILPTSGRSTQGKLVYFYVRFMDCGRPLSTPVTVWCGGCRSATQQQATRRLLPIRSIEDVAEDQKPAAPGVTRFERSAG
jgi:hypothetical protein